MNGKFDDNELDELIRQELLSVSAPADLRQKLLQPEGLNPPSWFSRGSANDTFFRRVLPVAACLVVALGIAFWGTADRHTELEEEIFRHMYFEEGQLDNVDAAVIPLDTVNTRMQASTGAHLQMSDAVKDLKVTFAKDCWVAKQTAFHMIMKGEAGPVTVMMIPSKERDTAFNISDDTYTGLVTPTEGGYLVVVGNRREPLTAYRNLLSGKLEWEY